MATSPFSSINLGPLEIAMLRKNIAGMLDEEEKRMGGLRERAGGIQTEIENLSTAPTPEVNPLEAGTQQLFGDMASILSRRQEFGQRSREDIQQRGAMLRQQRMQTIQVLRDKYQAIAAQAEKIDPIKALKYTEMVERQNKLLEQMHEDETLGFKEGKEDARNTERVRGGIEEAKIRARADFAAAQLRAATGGRGWSIELRNKHLGEINSRYFDPKTKKMDKARLPIYKAELLSTAPYEGQTEQQWILENQRALMAARGGKPLSQKELLDIISARAMHTFPDTEAANPTVEPPAPTGVEVSAARPQEISVATQSGRLSSRDDVDVSEVTRLWTRLQQPAQGVVDTAFRTRAQQRLGVLMEQLRKRGVIITLPAPVVEGVEVQGYTDEFLNREPE